MNEEKRQKLCYKFECNFRHHLHSLHTNFISCKCKQKQDQHRHHYHHYYITIKEKLMSLNDKIRVPAASGET